MQLPPGLEHPSAELHEEWLIYICNHHQVLSIHQQSLMKNGLYICNYHQVLSIHQQSFMKNGLYICNYHQVLSIHQQSFMKNGLYICNYHQVLSIHQQSFMKNGLYIYAITTKSWASISRAAWRMAYIYICNYHQVLSIHQQSCMKNGLYICNYHQVLSIHQQSFMKNGLYIYAITTKSWASISRAAWRMAYIYMQLPPGLEHPSAELHEEWLIYMQLPPGLEHPSAELHEKWLIYIYAITTKSWASISRATWSMAYIYMQLPPRAVPSPLNLQAFWESMSDCFPLLSVGGSDAIWMP